jgi:hypothetical protein
MACIVGCNFSTVFSFDSNETITSDAQESGDIINENGGINFSAASQALYKQRVPNFGSATKFFLYCRYD